MERNILPFTSKNFGLKLKVIGTHKIDFSVLIDILLVVSRFKMSAEV